MQVSDNTFIAKNFPRLNPATKSGACLSLFLLSTVLLLSTLPSMNVYGAGQTITTFTRTPDGYDSQTGAFRLGSEQTYDSGNAGGGICLTYDYFIFNAQAGEVLQGQVKSGSKTISYLILSPPSQLQLFDQNHCAGKYWGQASSGPTINWTAPSDGRYALVFMVSGFYDAPVYFTQ